MTESMYGIRPHRNITDEEHETMKELAERDEAQFRKEFWARQHRIMDEERKQREACGN